MERGNDTTQAGGKNCKKKQSHGKEGAELHPSFLSGQANDRAVPPPEGPAKAIAQILLSM